MKDSKGVPMRAGDVGYMRPFGVHYVVINSLTIQSLKSGIHYPMSKTFKVLKKKRYDEKEWL